VRETVQPWVGHPDNVCCVCCVIAVMAALCLYHWSDWKKSSKFFFFAWAFPFVWKFLQFSIPAYEATQLQPQAMAQEVLKYGYAQAGFSSFAQFNNIAQQALGDSLKMTLVKMGGADLLFTGAGLVADFKAGP